MASRRRRSIKRAQAAASGARRPSRRFRLELLEPRNLLAVVINEIHYNPDNPTELVEFIELHNTGASAVDLSGWRIDEAVDFTFTGGASIPAGAYAIVTQDAADFQAKYGFAPLGQWEAGDKLSNDGETIELRNDANALIDSVTYEPAFPWPVSGEFGSSIELVNPALDNSLGGNWRSSGLVASPAPPATLIPPGTTWSYRKGITTNPPANWHAVSFSTATDTVAWQSGVASIGYGDDDDNTNLTDMEDGYTSFYARRQFVLSGPIPTTLKVRLYVDDGAIVSINGAEVLRSHVTAGAKNFDGTSGVGHDAEWEEFLLLNADAYLVTGANVVAVHVLNQTLSSSDVSFNLELLVPGSFVGPPTPGVQNSVFAPNTAPQMRDLAQSVQQPAPGQEMIISMRVTDPDGVQSVVLQYQLVNPGGYIRASDPSYLTSWAPTTMHDDGLAGDATAGDGVYSVTLPSVLQTNRRLVRYRVTATDVLGASIQAPYADDPQPNFAYFVYSGVPGWIGANQPGVTPNVTFGTDVTQSISPYHLIANATDVSNSQYVSSFQDAAFRGTLVYDGVVYDHVEFQVRGEISTFLSGKNKWRISFNRGHEFAARDNYGSLYAEKWKRLNLNANASPWIPANRGAAGLDEAVSNRLFQLAGVEAPNTNYVHFRVIDDAAEASTSQYDGDLWGLYLAVEHTGGRFIDEHGLEDGNIYEIERGVGDSRNQAPDQPTDGSDWSAILAQAQTGTAPVTFWRNNINLDVYYSFDAISRAVSNVDVRVGDNYVMYHPPDGKWQIIPWDLDMMYVPETHHSGSTFKLTHLSNARLIPELQLEFKNRARELLDLLFSDRSRSGGQVAQLVDEFARMLNPSNGAGGYLTGWAELDQYLWNYNPRTATAHTGAFYRTPAGQTMRGGAYSRTLPSADFSGMAQWIIDFMTDTDPNAWAIGDGDGRGYGFNYLEFEATDANIPLTPTIAYNGAAGFPIDGLAFTTGAFADPNGSAFSKMEWRVGEVSNPGTPGFDADAPWKYEVDAVWESGELSTYSSGVALPGAVLEAGHTYRARVRMQDATGRWSHWSAPLEFTAAAAEALPTLAITELHYHPANHPALADDEDLEFIEVMNTGATAVDLSGVQLAAFANTPFVFANGVSLRPGERIVVARDAVSFQLVYGSSVNLAAGGFDPQNLNNAGETITLLAAGGAEIQSIAWTDDPPWPTAADGAGPSLEIIDPLGSPNDPANWRASSILGGSPGWSGAAVLAGDYDRDGDVDGSDFVVWQRNLGAATPALVGADGNGNMVVDGGDLAIWSDTYAAPQQVAAFAVSDGVSQDNYAASPAALSAIDLGGWMGVIVEPERRAVAPIEQRPTWAAPLFHRQAAIDAAIARHVDFAADSDDASDEPEANGRNWPAVLDRALHSAFEPSLCSTSPVPRW